MTVTDVWGLIRGQVAGLTSRDGDRWYFAVPSDATGTLVTEWWAQDEAGNIGHNAAILTLVEGAVKCIRMMRSDGVCTMRARARPDCTMGERPTMCRMRPFRCHRTEAC